MLQLHLSDAPRRWWPAAAGSLLWAVAAATAMLWWLHLPHHEGPTSAALAPSHSLALDNSAVARTLGYASDSVAAAPAEQKRFQLLGVISAALGQGSALIAVDGQPPKTYRMGQLIDGSWQLETVSLRAVSLKSQGRALDLTLPGSRQD